MELETIHKGRWKRLLNKLSWPRVPNIRLEKSLFSIDQIKKKLTIMWISILKVIFTST